MLPMDWNTAIRYARLVQTAEGVAPTADYGPAEIASIQAIGYKFVQQLYGDDLATEVDPHVGDLVSFGFLAISPAKEIVAAIRGTDTILEWIHDAAFLMVPSLIAGTHGFTEDGFTAVYRSLRIGRPNGSMSAKDSIQSYLHTGDASTVTVCGHSLGAALATFLTVDVALNTSCRTPVGYTYASPRTGDPTFAACYNAAVPASYRIANRQDLVPQLPPILPLPYEHVNTLYELVPGWNQVQPTIPCMHHLTTYLFLMAKLAGAAGFPLTPECVVPV